MLTAPEHRRLLLAEVRQSRAILQQARVEHRLALSRERGTLASTRARVREEVRQHRAALERARSRLAEDRRYHRQALAANRWLLTLVDYLLPLWGRTPIRRGDVATRPQRIHRTPDAKSGAGPMGRPSAAPYPGAG